MALSTTFLVKTQKAVAHAQLFGLGDPDNFLKVPLRGTFKKLSGLYGSARRCNYRDVGKIIF
jgi:hypothetical protein